MGKNSFGSKAVSSGYSHKGPVAGAPVVVAGGPGGGKTGMGSGVKKAVTESPDAAASGSAPKGLKSYKEGQGVKV